MTLFDVLILCRFYRDLITWNDLRRSSAPHAVISLSKKGLKDWPQEVIIIWPGHSITEGLTREKTKISPVTGSSKECPGKIGENDPHCEDLDRMLKEYLPTERLGTEVHAQVGWMPRLPAAGAGRKADPVIRVYISRKPRPVGG